jgi:PAS domain S-box-containing protein
VTDKRTIPAAIAERTGVPVVVVDREGCVTRWNDGAQRLFGWAEGDVLGDPSPTVPGEGSPSETALHQRVCSEGEVVRTEVEREQAAGETVTVDITTAPVYDDGAVAGRVSFFGRPEPDQNGQLTDSATLAHALRAFPDYVFLYDQDGRYLDAATGWEREYTLYEEADLIDKTVYDVLDESTADDVLEAIRAALDERDLKEVEYAVETPGGTFWYEAQVAPLPDTAAGTTQDGRQAVVLCARDVTQRREYREQLEAKNEQLESFARAVSHDLRNPLSVVKGQVGMARERTDEETPHLDLAAEAVERMETLVDDVLTLATQGRRIDEPMLADLPTLVRDAWRFHDDDDAATLVVDEDLGRVKTDPDRLRELFGNLFRNAVEHGDEGVTVRVAPLENGFYVADDGPGIPPAKREQVFDSGFTTSDEGTGFGLTIVAEIATAHGWEITVTAGEDGGARFEITGVEFD